MICIGLHTRDDMKIAPFFISKNLLRYTRFIIGQKLRIPSLIFVISLLRITASQDPTMDFYITSYIEVHDPTHSRINSVNDLSELCTNSYKNLICINHILAVTL